jgi:hypothetical protein
MSAPEHGGSDHSDQPIRFYFGIPLRARASALNWTQVCDNLARTLDSLARQTRNDFRVLISCHDIPDIDTRGLNVRFLQAGFAPPVDEQGKPRSDKHKKKRRLGHELAKEVTDGVYFMPLDADDLIHPELVEKVLSDDNRRGYLIERGWMFNTATGHYRECTEKQNPFWRYCGSCAVIYFEPDELPLEKGDKSRYYSRFLNHIHYAEVAEAAGRPRAPFSDAMAVYVINHGENDWTVYRQRPDGKTHYVEQRPVRDRRQLQTLKVLYPQLNAATPPPRAWSWVCQQSRRLRRRLSRRSGHA